MTQNELGGRLGSLQEANARSLKDGKILAAYVDALELTVRLNAVETAGLRGEDISAVWDRFDRRLLLQEAKHQEVAV